MLGLCLAIAALPAAAAAACGSTKRFAPTTDAGPGRPPLAIGDSVLLGAAKQAAAVGYAVDVRVCRSTAEGLDVLRARGRRKLPRLAVLALGANSDFTMRDIRTALRILGPRRTLGLVTPLEVAGLSTNDARKMRRAARRWEDRIVLLDWARFAGRRTRLTYSDGIHLTPRGRRAMTRFLRRALPYASKRKRKAETRPGAGEAPPAQQDDPDAGGLQV